MYLHSALHRIVSLAYRQHVADYYGSEPDPDFIDEQLSLVIGCLLHPKRPMGAEFADSTIAFVETMNSLRSAPHFEDFMNATIGRS